MRGRGEGRAGERGAGEREGQVGWRSRGGGQGKGRGRGEGGRGEGGAGEREGEGAGERGQGRGGWGEGVLVLRHTTHAHSAHTPLAEAPCSVDPCHLTPPCRWPRSPPVRDPREHICCHVQHLVLMPSPAFTEHCGCSDTSVSSRSCSKTGSINHLGRVTLVWTQVVHGHTLHHVSRADNRHNKHKEVGRPDKHNSLYDPTTVQRPTQSPVTAHMTVM